MRSRVRRVAAVLGRRWAGAAVRSRFGLSPAARRRATFARATREAFEELGPTFVKLGQLVSVRPDVFAPELVFEMERLQDRVAPLPAARVRETIRREFGREPEALFATFSDEPLASASIAQVHPATLREAYRPVFGEELPAGAEVAVKVVRPGAAECIEDDLRNLRRLTAALARSPVGRRVDVEGLLEEFAASLGREVDLRNEARVADRFAFDFRDDPVAFCPRVVWTRTTRRVLTMEYVRGWRLSELDDAVRAGVEGYRLALHGAEVFMRQVLVQGRFHADLHPANLLLTPDERIAYLDFGIVGELAPVQRAHVAQVLLATVYGDAERALRYSAELGLVVPEEIGARVRERVAALMARTLKREPADVKGFATGFLSIMSRHGVRIPRGFGLLVKALVTVEGCSRLFYPDIDILRAAKPFATRLVAEALLDPARLAERTPHALRAAVRELLS
ncbi:MAG: AarF/ABC1/UbiB kinase family protein [Coriobacteriia bacterium]|nr:AarF/ABC1/UbiB kinase family protein [Coriobacteriia bacterium]